MSDRTPKLPREGLTDTRPERESLDREDLAEKTPIPARRGGETVLVVEDDGAVRALLRMSIASRGYTVLEADQGSKAVQLA
jgi:PleD family two-component response regulator